MILLPQLSASSQTSSSQQTSSPPSVSSPAKLSSPPSSESLPTVLNAQSIPSDKESPPARSSRDSTPSDTSNSDNDPSFDADIPSLRPFAPRSPNSNRNDATNQASTQSSVVDLLGSDDPVNQASRVVFNAVIAGTLIVMVAFHVTALDPPPVSVGDLAGPPNLWELPVFFTFLQNVAIVAMASIDSPYAPFALFTDSFSWLLFLVKGSRPPSPSSRALQTSSHEAAFGIQQFALRLNIPERDLFVRAWTCFFVVMSAMLLLLCLFNGLATYFSRHNGPLLNQVEDHPNADRFEKWSLKVQGTLVWVLTQAVLPLTAVSVFEASVSQSPSASRSVSCALAVAVLVVIGGTCVGSSLVLWRQTESSLSKFHTKAIFGVLYLNLQFPHRAFCGVTLMVQFVSGAMMSGVGTPSTQMLWLVSVHGLYMLVLVVVRPFVTNLHLSVAVLVELVNIAIYCLCFAQAKAAVDDIHTKKTLGYVVMGLACLLVALFFVRTLVKIGKKLVQKNDNVDGSDRSIRREVIMASGTVNASIKDGGGIVTTLQGDSDIGHYGLALTPLERLSTTSGTGLIVTK
ncbi:hypothetical protein DYB26_005867 [Aphanomyces astaci]|uniref:TRP C-terminal domain-containing protein n=2 Tax=Aphanomyces astaci TaxID=112090 RepID=A0A418F0I1_APHAT|nr:hypothetical protein DYB26_005867 [Aphanomyces astaci]